MEMKRIVFAGSLVMAALFVPNSGTIANATENTKQAATVLVVGSNAEKVTDAFDKKTQDEVARKLKSSFAVRALLPVSVGNPDTDPTAPLCISYDDLETDHALLGTIKKQINQNRHIYLYGNALKVSEVEKTLGISFVNRSIISKDATGKQSDEVWQVIGYQKDDPSKLSFSNILVYQDPSTKLEPSKYPETFLQTILGKEQELMNRPTVKPMDYQSDPIVASQYNNNTVSYVGGTQVGQLNQNWLMHKSAGDKDPNYDYFYLEDQIEQTASNGATGVGMYIYHSMNYSTDHIRDWGPGSNTGTSFSVSLPWGAAWSFITNDSIAITTNGSQTSNYASWTIEKRWYQNNLVNPCRVKPGTAWASYGHHFASIHTEHTGHIYYNGNYYDMNLNKDATYSY